MATPLQLQILLSAIDRVSGPMRKVMGGTSAAAKAIRETQTRLKELDAAQRQISSFRQLHAGAKETAAAMAAQQARVDQLAARLRATEKPSRELNREFQQAVKVAGELKARHAAQERQLQGLRGRLEAAGISTRNLRQRQREMASEAAQATRALERQRQRLEQLAAAQKRMQKMHGAGMTMAAHGAGAIAAGGVAARGMGAPVAAYAQQEDSAAQLRAAMMSSSGKLGPEFAKIDALAQRLGNRLPGTTADFYEMLTMLRRQGMSAQTILGGLGEATGYLGAQLRMPYSEAALFAAQLQDATRSTEREMLALSDTIQRTFYLGVDPQNMLAGFGKLGPAMDTIRVKGIEGAKMLAPLLVMADQAGMAGEQAGNAYRKVLQLSMDAEKVGKANSLLKGTGIKLDFTDGKGEFGGLDRMFAQLKRLEQLNTQDRLAVIKKLFGDDAETLQVVSLMIEKGAAGYAQVQQKMAAQASLQQRVNLQLGTLKNLWDAASGTFVNGLASMGEAIAPELKALTEWLGAAAGRFQAWVKENPQLSATLFKVAAAVAAVVVVGGALALAIGTVLMPFAGLQMALATSAPLFAAMGGGIAGLASRALPLLATGFRGLASGVARGAGAALRFLPMLGNGLLVVARVLGGTAVRAAMLLVRALPLVATGIRIVGAALISNPIGLVIAAIAGLAYLIYRNWGTVGPWFAALWQGVTRIASAAWDWLKGLFAYTPLGAIVANWGAISSWFSALWARIRQFAADAWGALQRVLAWSPLGLVIANWGAIRTFLGTLFAGIRQYVAGAWNMIRGILTGDRTAIAQGMQGMWSAINSVLGGWPAKMLQAGVDMLNGLVAGIRSRIGAVAGTLREVGSGAVGALKSLLGIRSPSRVFAQLGGFTMQGFQLGLARNAAGPVDQVRKLGSRILEAGAGVGQGAMRAVDQVRTAGDRLRKAGAGLALGGVLPAVAAASGVAVDSRPPMARGTAAPTVVQESHSYQITVNLQGLATPFDVQEAVRRGIQQAELERASRRRSRLADNED